MLKTGGLVLNGKRIYRVHREEGLQVRKKRHKKLTRLWVPLALPSHVNRRRSVDFVSDQLATGRRFRVFDVVDDFSRECVQQINDFSIVGERLARKRNQVAPSRPLARQIVMDNSPELTSNAMFLWAKERGITLHFIERSKSTQKVLVESFNAKLWEYCLDLYWFAALVDARSVIEDWRTHYNHVGPHRSLGKKPPAVFAREAA